MVLGAKVAEENIAPTHRVPLQLQGQRDRWTESGQAPRSSHRPGLALKKEVLILTLWPGFVASGKHSLLTGLCFLLSGPDG